MQHLLGIELEIRWLWQRRHLNLKRTVRQLKISSSKVLARSLIYKSHRLKPRAKSNRSLNRPRIRRQCNTGRTTSKNSITLSECLQIGQPQCTQMTRRAWAIYLSLKCPRRSTDQRLCPRVTALCGPIPNWKWMSTQLSTFRRRKITSLRNFCYRRWSRKLPKRPTNKRR